MKQIDKVVMETLGNEFNLKSDLFQRFVYYILKDVLKDSIELQFQNDEPHLYILNIPNKDVGLIIDDLATIIKPINIQSKPRLQKQICEITKSVKPKNSMYNHYKLYKQYDNKDESNATQISRGNIISCSENNNIGLQPMNDMCPIRGNYTYILSDKKKGGVAVDSELLHKAIEYDMQYIINDFIINKSHFINISVLEQIIRKHNIDLFKMCIPYCVEQIKTSKTLLDLTIQEKQYEMFYQLLKYDIPITTECMQTIWKSGESKKLLTWVNLYGNDSNVDYYQFVDMDLDVEIIKLFIHRIEPIYIINYAITHDNYEMFTTFINLVDKYSVLSKCIENNRLNMIQYMYDQDMNDDVFNQILKESLRYGRLDVVKYIIPFQNTIDTKIWYNPDLKIEYLIDKDIIPYILKNCPCEYKYKLLLNAVYKNDEWVVKYIVGNQPDLCLSNFNDTVFKQAFINKNKNIMQMLLKLKRTFPDGLHELLELVKDTDMEEMVRANE